MKVSVFYIYALIFLLIAGVEGLYFIFNGFKDSSGLNGAYMIGSTIAFFLALNSISNFRLMNIERGKYLTLLSFLALILVNGIIPVELFILSKGSTS